jgi:hypothetical protein
MGSSITKGDLGSKTLSQVNNERILLVKKIKVKIKSIGVPESC